MGLFSSNKKVKFKGVTEDGREFNGEITLPEKEEIRPEPTPAPEPVRRHSGCNEKYFKMLKEKPLF